MYWSQMPGYAQHNVFGHERALPAWFWSGEKGCHYDKKARLGESACPFNALYWIFMRATKRVCQKIRG
jgi:deoxyribodipyrimidine photolyase-like uncharacterized protein